MTLRIPGQVFFCIATLLGLLPLPVWAVDMSGLLDARLLHDAGERSWTSAGMGKSRFSSGSALRLGQGILAAQTELGDTVTANAVINADDERRHVFDVQEGWVAWHPVPTSAWRMRAKAGMFFPPLNQEIDYARQTWTPTRTLSASAVNSWVGEELKTKGLELSLTHRGRAGGSPHDAGVTAAVFNGNDPAGTLLAWRGWAIGDRITGASEAITLADLPVYRADGPINMQTRDVHLFREIDGRAGYYFGANYSYADALQLSVMHYDNRGDPLVVKAGQYSWATKFNHVGMHLQLKQWDFMFQYMSGSTMMGQRAVALNYHAWYALASRRLGSAMLTVRYDQFGAREHDLLASDPNGETGRAVALAYAHELNSSLSIVSELLMLRSERPARSLIGAATAQAGNSVTTSLRWQF